MQGERGGIALLADLRATACLQSDRRFETHMKITSPMKLQSQSQFPLAMHIPHQGPQSKLGVLPYPLHLVAKSFFGAVKAEKSFLCTSLDKSIRNR